MPAFFGACSSSNSGRFLAVLGAGGVAGRGADAAIFLGDDVVVAQAFICGIAPELAAHAQVQVLGEGFGQVDPPGLST